MHVIGASHLARGVASGDVRDLVRHHAGQLGFIVSSQNQAGVHVEESAGQSEGVDVVGIHDLDRERHLRIGVAHQVLAHAIDVLGDHRVLNHLRAGLDHHRVLLAHLDVGVDRVPVAQTLAGLTHFAIADIVDIVLVLVVGFLRSVGRRPLSRTRCPPDYRFQSHSLRTAPPVRFPTALRGALSFAVVLAGCD